MPQSHVAWPVCKWQATMRTIRCMWDGSVEQLFVLMPQWETLARGQFLRMAASAGGQPGSQTLLVTTCHLHPGPQGARREGHCRDRPFAVAPGKQALKHHLWHQLFVAVKIGVPMYLTSPPVRGTYLTRSAAICGGLKGGWFEGTSPPSS